jgi:CheY-like chemotaxis protein
MMPVKDGWQFRAEQLEDPALAEIPTVIVSAAAGRDESLVATQLHAVAALRKPIDLARLAEIVGSYC